MCQDVWVTSRAPCWRADGRVTYSEYVLAVCESFTRKVQTHELDRLPQSRGDPPRCRRHREPPPRRDPARCRCPGGRELRRRDRPGRRAAAEVARPALRQHRARASASRWTSRPPSPPHGGPRPSRCPAYASSSTACTGLRRPPVASAMKRARGASGSASPPPQVWPTTRTRARARPGGAWRSWPANGLDFVLVTSRDPQPAPPNDGRHRPTAAEAGAAPGPNRSWTGSGRYSPPDPRPTHPRPRVRPSLRTLPLPPRPGVSSLRRVSGEGSYDASVNSQQRRGSGPVSRRTRGLDERTQPHRQR